MRVFDVVIFIFNRRFLSAEQSDYLINDGLFNIYLNETSALHGLIKSSCKVTTCLKRCRCFVSDVTAKFSSCSCLMHKNGSWKEKYKNYQKAFRSWGTFRLAHTIRLYFDWIPELSNSKEDYTIEITQHRLMYCINLAEFANEIEHACSVQYAV